MESETRKRAQQDSESDRPLLNPQQLLPGLDYLYCPDCGHHVGCLRLQPGVWEVQCPRCVGECGLCGCKSTGSCQGKDGKPVQTHTYVSGRRSK